MKKLIQAIVPLCLAVEKFFDLEVKEEFKEDIEGKAQGLLEEILSDLPTAEQVNNCFPIAQKAYNEIAELYQEYNDADTDEELAELEAQKAAILDCHEEELEQKSIEIGKEAWPNGMDDLLRFYIYISQMVATFKAVKKREVKNEQAEA